MCFEFWEFPEIFAFQNTKKFTHRPIKQHFQTRDEPRGVILTVTPRYKDVRHTNKRYWKRHRFPATARNNFDNLQVQLLNVKNGDHQLLARNSSTTSYMTPRTGSKIRKACKNQKKLGRRRLRKITYDNKSSCYVPLTISFLCRMLNISYSSMILQFRILWIIIQPQSPQ